MLMPSTPEEPTYPQGQNPESLKNLHPRDKIYGEDKRDRRLTVTETGWLGCKGLAHDLGLSGVSELLEKLGRKELEISQ
jgi:hypothetical protein